MRFLLLICLCVPGLQAAKDPVYKWHMGEESVFEGRYGEVFGSMVFVQGKRNNALIPLDKLTNEETTQLAKLLLAQPRDRKIWTQSAYLFSQKMPGMLQVLKGEQLVPFEPGERPEPLVYLLYFSAGWCGPCHRYTPELVRDYEALQKMAPGMVEVVFVSRDENRAEQRKYALEMKMPWPVLNFNYADSERSILRWLGRGIPCLVAVTRDGELLFHSYNGEDYLGPDHVMQRVMALVSQLNPRAADVRQVRFKLEIELHRLKAAQQDLKAKPWMISINKTYFAKIDLSKVQLKLHIDEKGVVKEAELIGKLDAVDEDQLLREARNWLFLPEIKAGVAVPTTVTAPVVL